MDSPNAAAKLLRELREFGVKIYLDDFGTGYSSLSHLHKLPVDALKIDRSFVKSLLLPDRPAIVESILALARTLNTSVVAEGIEDDVQACEVGTSRLHARPGLRLLAPAVDQGRRGNAGGQPSARGPKKDEARRTSPVQAEAGPTRRTPQSRSSGRRSCIPSDHARVRFAVASTFSVSASDRRRRGRVLSRAVRRWSRTSAVQASDHETERSTDTSPQPQQGREGLAGSRGVA